MLFSGDKTRRMALLLPFLHIDNLAKEQAMKCSATLFTAILMTAGYVFANDTITINVDCCGFDAEKKMILFTYNPEMSGEKTNNPGTIAKIDEYYRFAELAVALEPGKKFCLLNAQNDTFTMHVTSLPIINIASRGEIASDTMVRADFILAESSGNIIASDIGISYRGSFALLVAKKSFRVELWSDTAGTKTRDCSLLGMRNDDDWNLQALYNEPLRLRNKVGFELWKRIDTLYYSHIEKKATNGIKLEYVELFLNGRYQGVYGLGERIDKKQLKLKEPDGNSINGELYKGVARGATTFASLPLASDTSTLWDGFEYKYPEGIIDWSNLYNFVDFVMNADDDEFYEKYEDKLCIENAVNYFILLNLLRATDNNGKNIYIAKYTRNQPWFFVPWDLDGIFGTYWAGVRDTVTNDILTNGLYSRLLKDYRANGFVERLEKRWCLLRQTTITHSGIMKLFNDNLDYLKNNGVYEREAMAWDTFSCDYDNLTYISDWVEKRLSFLDSAFCPSTKTIKNGANKNVHGFADASLNPLICNSRLIYQGRDKPIAIRIVTASGRVVYQDKGAAIESADISRLNGGVYFVMSRFARKSITTGIVVAR